MVSIAFVEEGRHPATTAVCHTPALWYTVLPHPCCGSYARAGFLNVPASCPAIINLANFAFGFQRV